MSSINDQSISGICICVRLHVYASTDRRSDDENLRSELLLWLLRNLLAVPDALPGANPSLAPLSRLHDRVRAFDNAARGVVVSNVLLVLFFEIL